MGRRSRFSTDAMLDAALALFEEGGGEAVRMVAVAEKVGAPSGSVYHRFASRGALIGALWNRTTARFQLELQPFLERAELRAGAARLLQWCAERPGETALLLAGPGFADVEWPDEAEQAHRDQRRNVARLLASAAEQSGVEVEFLGFVLVDLPMASVRRGLSPRKALRAIGSVLPAAIDLEWLAVGHEERLRTLRLRALLESPDAFASTFDETVTRPLSNWTAQLESCPTVVAMLDGRDVGMVRAVPGEPWNLISMWVAPEVRGRGVGGRLVRALAERGGALRLEVRSDNHAARRLYERLGFTYTGAGEDQLEMSRPSC